MEEFLAARDSPVEREIYLMLEEADAVLYNWLGKEQLVEAVAVLPFMNDMH